MQDDILGAGVLAGLALDLEDHGARNTQPCLAGDHGGHHVSRAHAERQGLGRAAGTGVRVGAEHDGARLEPAFFHGDDMADALAAAEDLEAELAAELFRLADARGDVGVRPDDRVVEEDADLSGVEHLVDAMLAEHAGNRRRVAVLEIDAVDVDRDELVRLRLPLD